MSPPSHSEKLFELFPHFHACLLRHSDLHLLVRREAVSKEDPVPWPVHRAFVTVYLQLHFPLQESGHRGHHPLAAALRGNVDVAVVRVTAKGVTSCLQFLVEVIEQDV